MLEGPPLFHRYIANSCLYKHNIYCSYNTLSQFITLTITCLVDVRSRLIKDKYLGEYKYFNLFKFLLPVIFSLYRVVHQFSKVQN